MAVAQTVESITATLALVAGGIFASIKFLKNRTYRPRLDVSIETERVASGERLGLLCQVIVKNIGTSKVSLQQYGTGLHF
jgi:hypothetical protein